MNPQTLSNAANYTQVIWGTLAGFTTLGTWFLTRKKLEQKHAVEFALLQQAVNYIKERMEKEFGGNSGGIRERINAMDGKIDKIEEKVDANAIDIAKITGQFSQHIEEME